MRRPIALFCVLSFSLLLAACGGGSEENTPAPADVFDVATQQALTPSDSGAGDGTLTFEDYEQLFLPEASLEYISPTPGLDGALPFAPPGTLVASETEDPAAGQPFDYLRFSRRGGRASGDDPNTPDTEIMMVVYPDGRAYLDDFEGHLDAAVIEGMIAAIDEVNYFGIHPLFDGPPRDENEYRYSIEIHRSGNESLINAQESRIPVPFALFLASMQDVAEILIAQRTQAEIEATATAAAIATSEGD